MARVFGPVQAHDYQERILGDVDQAVEQRRSGVVFVTTGGGKGLLVGGVVEDIVRRSRGPVLIIQPNRDLLQQNLRWVEASGVLAAGASASVWAAATEKFQAAESTQLKHRDCSADITFATAGALTRNRIDLRDYFRSFGERGGVVLVDEGQGAAADGFGDVLRHLASSGAMGILFTATPFRTDGRDVLEPFGASLHTGIIASADFNEVLGEKRVVAPKFDVAREDFAYRLGEEALARIDGRFEDLLSRNRTIDQASQQSFSSFFADTATPEDRLIAAAVSSATVGIWRDRAADRNLALFHCDSLGFARAVGNELAGQTMPEGHPRAGQPVRVGYVDADTVLVSEAGRLVEVAGPKVHRRETLLNSARERRFDVLVNCEALGVGTDIPPVDMSMLCCLERSPGPFLQSAVGRGARAFEDPVTGYRKKNNLIVDIGRTVMSIGRDVEALKSGELARCRTTIASLPEPLRRQFIQIYDADPDFSIDPRVQERRASKVDPLRQDQEVRGDRQPEGLDEAAGAARFIDLAEGIRAASRSTWDGETRSYENRVALLVDLKRSGLLGNHPPDGLPRHLVVTISDRAPGLHHSFLTDDPAKAEAFAAFVGVRHDSDYHISASRAAPSSKQLRALGVQAARAGVVASWLRDPVTEVATKLDANSAIGALANLAALQEALGAALANRISERRETGRTTGICVLSPHLLGADRLALLGALCRTSAISRLYVLKPDSRDLIDRELAGSKTKVHHLDPRELSAGQRSYLETKSAGGAIRVIAPQPGGVDRLKARLEVGARKKARTLDSTLK